MTNTPRKYTLDEIDRMRGLVRDHLGGSFMADDQKVEDRLRTYMLGGVSAEDLIERAEKRAEAFRQECVRAREKMKRRYHDGERA